MSTKNTKAVVEETTASTNEVVVEETAKEVISIEEDTPSTNDAITINSSKYTLSKRCPERLQFNGVVYTKEELLTNEEVFTSLVVGGSPFVQKI